MESVFSELSLVIVFTAIISIFMRMLKQPLILGYIIAGLIVGPAGFNLIHADELFSSFSEIGIALLLFIIGLGIQISELRRLGKVVIVGSLASLTTITLVGYATANILGFSKSESFILGLALFFSSTIIIVKLLTDKKEQNRLHGQIAIGIILVEDLIATMALLFVVAGRSGGGINISELLVLGAKSIFLLAFLGIASTKVLPKVSKYMAGNQELLFLFAIAWGFGIATLFEKAGFSIEIGALFAGVALAMSPFVQEIASRLRPLRDFFIVLFFITLGKQMDVNNLKSVIFPALVLSLIVIIIKPLVITTASGLLGYAKRVSFKTGINMSQISEFSLVLVFLAVSDNIVSPKVGSTITLVAIITIAISTYLIQYDEKLFKYFDKININLFEKEAIYKEKRSARAYQNIIFGYHHGGHEFIKTFKDMNKKFLVIDYDPEVIEILQNQKVDYLYGDAKDMELLNEAGIEKCKMVVSTINDHQTNVFLANLMAQVNSSALIISHANNINEATELYDLGVGYVMIPHHVGSERMSALIKRTGGDKDEFRKHRERHIASLEAHLNEVT